MANLYYTHSYLIHTVTSYTQLPLFFTFFAAELERYALELRSNAPGIAPCADSRSAPFVGSRPIIGHEGQSVI